MEDFSLNSQLLRTIFSQAKPLGHNEQEDKLNLGFGFVYYGLVRAFRPKARAGNRFGIRIQRSVSCFGSPGQRDGRVTFVDPSYSLLKHGPFKTLGGRGNWDKDDAVARHFAKFGVQDIVTHYKLRSDELFSSYGELQLPPIDLAFIDGSHTFEDVR